MFAIRNSYAERVLGQFDRLGLERKDADVTDRF
jgi:hypothetical protein